MNYSLVVGSGFTSQREYCKCDGIIALDIDSQKVKNAKRQYPDAYYIVGDARFLPFRSGFFKDVVCTDVLEHIQNYDDLVFNIVNLKPRSILLRFPTEMRENILTKVSKVYREQHFGKIHVAVVQPMKLIEILKRHRYNVHVDLSSGVSTLVRVVMFMVLELSRCDYRIPEIGLVSFRRQRPFHTFAVLFARCIGQFARIPYLLWKLFRIKLIHDNYIIEAFLEK